MLRVAMRAMVVVWLLAFLGGTVAGQTTPKKPVPRKPAAKTAPAKAEPAKTEPAAKPAAPAAPSDIKIRTRYTSGAQVSENTTYVKGARQRVEFPAIVSIDQSDLGRALLVNPASRTYLVKPYAKAAPDSAATPAATSTPAEDSPQAVMMGQKAPAKAPKGGVITYTTTLTDTGERKQLFSREARRITTTVTKEASASACDKSAETVEMDGWYIDFPGVAPVSTAAAAPAPAAAPKGDACVDRVETRKNGDAKLGFPIAMKTTTKTGEGDKQTTITSSMEVTSFEVTTLDAALFDVPAGYTEAKSSEELLSGLQAGGGLADALLGSTADGTSSAAPKSAGVVRIGVLEPVDKSSRNLPTRELRQELASDFRAPFEALTLAGTSPAGAQADAGRMQCDYVLYSEIADIKTSKPGRVGGMLKKVSGDGPPRDVHEVRLDYKLYPVGAATAPSFADTTKASSGGNFNVKSALHLAMLAGSLYLRFTGLGLLSPTLMSQIGGGLGPLGSSGLFDPRMSAMSSITQLAMSGGVDGNGDSAAGMPGGDDSEAVIRQTVGTALANAAKGTVEQLQKNKK